MSKAVRLTLIAVSCQRWHEAPPHHHQQHTHARTKACMRMRMSTRHKVAGSRGCVVASDLSGGFKPDAVNDHFWAMRRQSLLQARSHRCGRFSWRRADASISAGRPCRCQVVLVQLCHCHAVCSEGLCCHGNDEPWAHNLIHCCSAKLEDAITGEGVQYQWQLTTSTCTFWNVIAQ